jgi:hypothetical protein
LKHAGKKRARGRAVQNVLTISAAQTPRNFFNQVFGQPLPLRFAKLY